MVSFFVFFMDFLDDIREFKKTTTATGRLLNKRFNERNNGCALAL